MRRSVSSWWLNIIAPDNTYRLSFLSRDHVRAYQQWLYSHLPLTLGIVSIAVGVKRVIVLAPYAMMPVQEAFILSASAGVCMLSLNTIFLSSYPGKPPDAALRFVLPQYMLAVLAIAAGALAFVLSGIALLGILTALSILQILYSMRSLPDQQGE